MTLKDYRELSPEDKVKLLELISTYLIFDTEIVLDLGSKPVNDIEGYVEARMQERKKNTSFTWPEKLSKREFIICRLNMVQGMLLVAPCLDQDSELMKRACQVFIKSVMEPIYQWKPGEVEPGKKYPNGFPGLDQDVASVINHIYQTVNKYFEKKIE